MVTAGTLCYCRYSLLLQVLFVTAGTLCYCRYQ
jgi:hypothetical protein